ncbi:hypothetical protein LTR08_006521 [Meristemomyces frigidus]|nr:hypothetical protein LTR08_006521 [Meristemomyces frigidus]
MLSKTFLLALAAAFTAVAQNAAYAQCGGQSWTGSTACVSGYTCKSSSAYYSQCVLSSAVIGSTLKATTTKSPAAASSIAASSSGNAPSGQTFKASFTEYGSGDSFGSGNCNTATTACGFYTSPGYSAAVSQAEFGVGPGAGAGPACGSCWKLTIQTDSNGKKVSNAGNSIVVQVTNLCPASGNPLCAQNGLSGTNQYGANLNFDTCIDSKASAALFGSSGVALGVGTAQEVDCKGNWSGTVVH